MDNTAVTHPVPSHRCERGLRDSRHVLFKEGGTKCSQESEQHKTQNNKKMPDEFGEIPEKVQQTEVQQTKIQNHMSRGEEL